MRSTVNDLRFSNKWEVLKLLPELQRPVVCFDLEATDVDPFKAKICQFAAIKIFPDGNQYHFTTLVNPEIPMPEGAFNAHGISDEMVKDEKPFADIAEDLFDFVKDCDVAGYNIIRYDIPMLIEEFARVGIQYKVGHINMLDFFILYKKYNPANLTTALITICEQDLTQYAHDALADADATLSLGCGLISQNPDLQGIDMNAFAEICRYGPFVDPAGKLTLDDDKDICYNIGKAKGTKVRANPSFGMWMLAKDFPESTKRIIREVLNIKK